MNQVLGQNGYRGPESDPTHTLSPNPSPSRERGISDPIKMIAEGRHSVEAVCRASGLSILELARIVTTPDNLKQLQQVTQLHAIEREMLLGRLRIDALMRLRELTDEVPASSADEVRAAEVMRKACVDLLRYGVPGTVPDNLRTRNPSSPLGGPRGGGPGSRGYHRESITPATEAEVLEALERLGQEDGEEEEEVYPQITQIAQMRHEARRSENENGFEHRVRASGSLVPPHSETTRRKTRLSFKRQPGEEPGADTSGSFTHPTRNPLHQPRPPPYPIPPLFPTP